jgi:hypothetical protein
VQAKHASPPGKKLTPARPKDSLSGVLVWILDCGFRFGNQNASEALSFDLQSKIRNPQSKIHQGFSHLRVFA